METSCNGLDQFDPKWPEFQTDPYRFYEYLQNDPVHYVKETNSWWLVEYEDVARILSDSSFLKEPLLKLRGDKENSEELKLRKARPPNMVFRDPPDHSRLRKLVDRAFTRRMVDTLEPRILEMANSLLAQLYSKRHFDLVADFAFPLPAMVIADLLGVPKQDREKFKTWSEKDLLALDASQPEKVILEGIEAQNQILGYFRNQIAIRRGQKNDEDLLSSLITIEERGDKLSSEELESMCALLLVAGHETTTNLISGGILALIQNPSQLELLRHQSELMPNAIEELLRFVSPVQRTERVAPQDIEIKGKKIRKGEFLTLVLASANRDPKVFKNPNSLDIARKENPHLSFALGIHFCLGAPLARIEAGIAFRCLINRFPEMKLAAEPIWKPNTFIRGPRSVIVEVL